MAAKPSPSPAMQRIIDSLELIPHPEGGFFRETWRAGAEPMASRGETDPKGDLVQTNRAPPERNTLTSIYYMIAKYTPQPWISNMSDHVHYHHAGGTLLYCVAHPDGRYEELRLGQDFEAGDRPQIVVPGGGYKCVRLLGDAEFALIGEGVGPGFDSRDFKFATRDDLQHCPEALEKAADLLHGEATKTFDSFYD